MPANGVVSAGISVGIAFVGPLITGSGEIVSVVAAGFTSGTGTTGAFVAAAGFTSGTVIYIIIFQPVKFFTLLDSQAYTRTVIE